MCKASSVASCLPRAYHEYELSVAKELLILRSKNSTKGEKTRASESLGEKAALAYNAHIHNMTLDESTQSHSIFSGCSVIDAGMEHKDGTVEVKEAKGGKSHYGTRRDINGKKRVTQCTPSYNKVINHKMKHSNYKGRHPTIGCNTHTNAPVGTCKGCKNAEKDHRKKWGNILESSVSKRKYKKRAVRGDYNDTCVSEPSLIESYELDKNGNKQMIDT